MKFMIKKIIITGGAGFIGSHLLEELLKNNYELIVIDNLSTGFIDNIKKFLDKIHFINDDLESIDLNKFDGISAFFHLAAQTSVPYSIENFYSSSKSNILGSLKVIEYCSNKSIPLIYASSSAVYGNMSFGDENGKIDLLSPYSVDKYSMELYADYAHKIKKLNSFGHRFFNVYGPRQDPNSPYSGVISIFVNRLLKKQKIYVNGGYQTRDFVFVKDVVKCLLKSLNFLENNSGNFISNILTGKSISINDLVNQLSSILNFNAECVYRDLDPSDPEKSSGSIKNMEKLLKVDSKKFTVFESGLIKTIEWIKKNQ
tara:strand:+ start:12056 stop:12997 length:942 start_codon:yes stop_codon:yes gene_type:complete